MKTYKEFITEAASKLKLDPLSGEDRGKLIAAGEDSKVKIVEERDSKGYVVYNCAADSLDASAVKSRAKNHYKAKFKEVS